MKCAGPRSLQPTTHLTPGSRRLLRPALDRRVDGGHPELESGAVAVAGRDPNPAPEGALHHEPAQVEPEAKAALRTVAAGRAGLFEERFETGGGRPRPPVGGRDLPPRRWRGFFRRAFRAGRPAAPAHGRRP